METIMRHRVQVFQISVKRKGEFMVATIEPPKEQQTPETMAQAFEVAHVWAPIFARSEEVQDAFKQLVAAIGREVLDGAFGASGDDIELEQATTH
jgi:hypothetical protein